MKTLLATAAILGLTVSMAAACPFSRSVSAEAEPRTDDMTVASTAGEAMSSPVELEEGTIIVAQTDDDLAE